MKNFTKRLLSFAVALVMVLGMLPVTQLEAEAATDATAQAAAVVAPEDKTAPEHINDDLVFDEGTTKAMCYACNKKVEWTPLTTEKVTTNGAAIEGKRHFYVPDQPEGAALVNSTFSGGTGNYSFFMYVNSSDDQVCLHLNGNSLVTSGIVFLGSSATMNVMGQGNWTSSNGYASERATRGACIHVNSVATVNVYGGNLQPGTDNRYALSRAVFNSDDAINIYDGATVGGFRVFSGKVNIYGGKINKPCLVQNGWMADGSDYSTTEVNMFSGTTVEARFSVGKDTTEDTSGEDKTKNNEPVVFNLWGGTVSPVSTADNRINESGGAFNLWEGSELNIHGGTINGAYLTLNDPATTANEAQYGSAIYASRPSVANADGSLRKTVINMTAGTINGGGVYSNSVKNLAAACGGALHLYGVGSNGDVEFNMSGGTINGGYTVGGAIYNDGAEVVLSGNATIQNGYSPSEGGNIVQKSAGAKLTIKDNVKILNGEAIASDSTGIGGNLCIKDGTLDIQGGRIADGTSHSNGGGGGNIYICSPATMTMSGGSLEDGYNENNQGGNMYALNATVTMTGGKMLRGKSCNGGNLSLVGATFYMYGGEIKEGTTREPSATATYGNGGNIYISSSGKAYILGGTVSDGKALNCNKSDGIYGGGNIIVVSGTLTIGKNPETDAPGTVSGGTAWSGGNILVRTSGNLIVNDGAVISGGHATGVPYVSNTTKGTRTNVHGGGNIYVKGGKVTVNGGLIEKGIAEANGGNIMLCGAATLTVNGGTITEGVSNFVPGDTKGPTETGDKDGFGADWGSAGGGGNIFLKDTAKVTVANATISNGIAVGGGNILAGANAAATITLNDGAVVTGGTSRKQSINSYYRAGNIQVTSGPVVYINKGARVYGGVSENGRNGKDVSAVWKSDIYLNGGTIGTSADIGKYVVDLYGSYTSPNTDMTINGGTIYGKIYRSGSDVIIKPTKENDVVIDPGDPRVEYKTNLFVNHGTFASDPTTALSNTVVNGLTASGAGTSIIGTGVKYQNALTGMYEVHKNDVTAQTPVPATCTTDGYTLNTCSHTYTVGETTYTCEGYKTNIVTAPGHVWDTEDYTFELDTETGNSVVTFHCDGCGMEVESERPATSEITTYPTCQEEGVRTWKHYVYTEYVDFIAYKEVKLGYGDHEFENYRCKWCNQTPCELNGGEHSFDYTSDNYSVVKQATCLEGEYRTYWCSGCGIGSETKIIEGTERDHNIVYGGFKNNTCTEAGYNTYNQCSYEDCNTYFDGDNNVIADLAAWKAEGGAGYMAPMGHQFNNYMLKQEATCSSYAILEAECDICHQATDQKVDEERGLREHDYDPATGICRTEGCGKNVCDINGYHMYMGQSGMLNEDKTTGTIVAHCSQCNGTKELAATVINSSVITDPSCEVPGQMCYELMAETTDGSVYYSVYAEIPAPGHDYSAAVTPPTCEQPGFTTYTCKCGHSYTGDEKEPAGHTYSTVVTPPTCEQPGYTTYTCTCGDSYIADHKEALGHDWSEYKALNDDEHKRVCSRGDAEETVPHNYQVIASTIGNCMNAGSETKECVDCGHQKSTFTELDHNNHVGMTFVPQVNPTVNSVGYEAYYTCVCGGKYADAEGMQPIFAPAEIPKLIVETEVPKAEDLEIKTEEPVSEEQKQEIVSVVQNSTQISKVENLPEEHYLSITFESVAVEEKVATKWTYDVTPMKGEDEVHELEAEITFYLPIPTGTGKATAAVFHGDKLLMAEAPIVDDGTEAYVAVTAKSFSRYTVDLDFAVAQVNGKKYATFEGALAAAMPGDVIVLLGDVTETAPIFAEDKSVDLNGKHLKADIFTTVIMNGGTFETSQHVMAAPTGAKYNTTDAVMQIAYSNFDTTLVFGTVTLGDPNWWTLPNQTLTVAEEAEFIIPADYNLNVNNSTVIVNGKVTVDGTVTLFDAAATVQAAEGLNIVLRDGIGDKVWYTEGKYTVHTHTKQTLPAVDPTLTSTGLTAGEMCSVCKDILTEQQVIESLCVATVNDTPYASLQAALAAAKALGGATVMLQKDVDLGDEMVEVKDKVTLDLNGKTLKTTGYVLALFHASYITDSSDDNSGRLVVNEDMLRLLKENIAMPVQMANGLMFAQLSVGHQWGHKSGLYQLWLNSADGALAEALKTTKASELGLKFQVEIVWGENVLCYTYSDEVVMRYMNDERGWDLKAALTLTLHGAENTEGLTYRAKVVSGAGTQAEVVCWTSTLVDHVYAQ